MKVNSILIGLTFIVAGCILFSFKKISPQTTDSHQGWGKDCRLVQQLVSDLYPENGNHATLLMFSVKGLYDRRVSKSMVVGATTIEALVPDIPAFWIERFDDVWIKSKTENGVISLMSEGNVLSAEQRELLRLLPEGSELDIMVNYHNTNRLTNEAVYDRFEAKVTIAPETEASFKTGYDSLIRYFEENTKKYQREGRLDKFQSVAIHFYIDAEGRPEDVEAVTESGFPDVDAHVVKLVKEMPAWKPAKNSQGKACRQAFELIFGFPGC